MQHLADKESSSADVLPDGRTVSFESSFGWHSLDVRTGGLPPLTKLQKAGEHLVGVRDGKRVYLCTARKAVTYGLVERSRAFSEHYGACVYICQEA